MRDFPLAAFVILVAGYVLWSIAFVALYAGHGVACMALPRNAWVVMLAIWAGGVTAHAALAFWLARARTLSENGASRFVQRCALGLGVAAFAAAIGVGLPILFVPPCD